MGFVRKQNRLNNYDYSQPGYYFVTACTKDRKEYFGSVNIGKIDLSEMGKVVEEVWKRTPKLYKIVDIDEFVVMPNHLHGIVIIKPGEQAGGLRYSLDQIVGSFKNVVTKFIRKQFIPDFAWQPSFYYHVIRKEEGLDKIREYIRNNPLKWELDRNNLENLWM
jgi:REP element-mobilizing transposase RayT